MRRVALDGISVLPKIYRAMKVAADGLPVVGNQSKELGVREPPSIHADVDVDSNGAVVLNGRDHG